MFSLTYFLTLTFPIGHLVSKEEKEDIPGYLTAESHWRKNLKENSKTKHSKVTFHCKIPPKSNQKHTLLIVGPRSSTREQSSDLDTSKNIFSVGGERGKTCILP